MRPRRHASFLALRYPVAIGLGGASGSGRMAKYGIADWSARNSLLKPCALWRLIVVEHCYQCCSQQLAMLRIQLTRQAVKHNQRGGWGAYLVQRNAIFVH